jgi:hypothetical protein
VLANEISQRFVSICLMDGFTEVIITVHCGCSFTLLAGLWQLSCNHGSSKYACIGSKYGCTGALNDGWIGIVGCASEIEGCVSGIGGYGMSHTDWAQVNATFSARAMNKQHSFFIGSY